MKKGISGKEVTITGAIEGTKKNQDGDICAIKIVTDDGEYLIEDNDMGKEMINLAGEKVKVSGMIRKEKEQIITVSDYEPAEDMGNYEEDGF
ncbi:MAG: hypothetical protein HQK79_16370 [Desulfobacterales bacterium]|nr:hypothetical protein [Desulfobacterales bacterium]MBF0397042.1 hypothetical protein [Desulfobacterales bacterium]